MWQEPNTPFATLWESDRTGEFMSQTSAARSRAVLLGYMCVVLMALMIIVRTVQTVPAHTATTVPAVSDEHDAPRTPLPAGPRKFQ